MYRLRSFISYYGGKHAKAHAYPDPIYDTIVEPFAGSAGYSVYHYNRNVILIEKYRILADIWQWLIDVSEHEFLSLPSAFVHIDDLKQLSTVEKNYLGFRTSMSPEKPARCINVGYNLIRGKGWTESIKRAIAEQLKYIRHFKIYCGSYVDFDIEYPATWFIDPPYNHREGSRYVHSDINYAHLASWCKTRKGQVIACENLGANWLPFQPLYKINGGQNKRRIEVMWHAENI